MELKRIDHKLTICKVTELSSINMESDFFFIGKTDEELSLVCKTEDTPKNTIERDDGGKASVSREFWIFHGLYPCKRR